MEENEKDEEADVTAFRVSAPKVWNTLPLHIRQSQSLSTFRRHLKKHYFQLAYT